ncbi:hypothetical protein YC2023_032996 [Brassica napus]
MAAMSALPHYAFESESDLTLIVFLGHNESRVHTPLPSPTSTMETREIVPGIKSVSCGVTKLSVGEQVRPATIPITRSNHNFKLSAILSEPSSAPIATGQEEAEPSKPARTNRCFSCNKKAGVMGFKCKFGSTFCRSHRCPEKHECSFNFKEVGRDVIAKANHVIKEDKVERI